MFAQVIVVDWSASATRGPAKPAPDRCWIAWGPPPGNARYCRTRLEAIDLIAELLKEIAGNGLVAWDFPFGYPAGSGLGAGRDLATRLAGQIIDRPDASNNRFDVAAALNRSFGPAPGPFWGCPPSAAGPDLTPTKNSFAPHPVGEWRLVDQLARRHRHNIQSAWKLYTTGSVGSQILMGLPAVNRLLCRPDLAARSRVWPFETDWEQSLSGIIHAEMWPSLCDHSTIDHPIKDARQVMATCAWMCGEMAKDRFHAAFARPPGLTDREIAQVEAEEGWILGVPALLNPIP